MESGELQRFGVSKFWLCIFALEIWIKRRRKIRLRFARVVAEIRAELLPNTSVEGCDCTDLLDTTWLMLSNSLKTRQALYVWRNIEAHSPNHCCRAKTVSITYCECVFVAVGFQHTMRLRCTVICGLSGPTVIFHIILQTAWFAVRRYWA